MNGPVNWPDAIKSLCDCIQLERQCSEKELADAIYNWESGLLMLDEWPDDLAREVERLVEAPGLRQAPGGWRLIRVVMTEWPKIDASSQQRLMHAFGRVFGLFEDWMVPFTISELVGERVATSEGIGLLEGFKGDPSAQVRSCVAHGLGDIGRNAGDEAVRMRACKSLHSMQNDKDSGVKAEVEQALKKAGVTP